MTALLQFAILRRNYARTSPLDMTMEEYWDVLERREELCRNNRATVVDNSSQSFSDTEPRCVSKSRRWKSPSTLPTRVPTVERSVARFVKL